MRFDITWVETLDSTNSYLKARQDRLPRYPTPVIAARQQRSGRGREARYWISAPYKDIACSLLLPTRAPLHHLPSLTMAVALAVRAMLSDTYAIPAAVKWPNDVLVHGRKICGILSELLPDNGAIPGHRVLMGIGLNVGMAPEMLATIDQPATSMSVENSSHFIVDTVLETFLATLPPWLARWEEGGFSALRSEWLRHEQRLHTQIRVKQGKTALYGILEGFGDDGELLLRDAEGRIIPCIHGDVFHDTRSAPPS